MAHVEIDDETGCWEWLGPTNAAGYGKISLWDSEARKKSSAYVHRVSYEEFVGPIPEGMTLDHLCCNRACVNFDHLEPVTLEENARRGGINQRFMLA